MLDVNPHPPQRTGVDTAEDETGPQTLCEAEHVPVTGKQGSSQSLPSTRCSSESPARYEPEPAGPTTELSARTWLIRSRAGRGRLGSCRPGPEPDPPGPEPSGLCPSQMDRELTSTTAGMTRSRIYDYEARPWLIRSWAGRIRVRVGWSGSQHAPQSADLYRRRLSSQTVAMPGPGGPTPNRTELPRLAWNGAGPEPGGPRVYQRDTGMGC